MSKYNNKVGKVVTVTVCFVCGKLVGGVRGQRCLCSTSRKKLSLLDYACKSAVRKVLTLRSS